MPNGDANACLLQPIVSSQMPQIDHADCLCAVFTHYLPSSDKDFLHLSWVLARMEDRLTIKWQADKEP